MTAEHEHKCDIQHGYCEKDLVHCHEEWIACMERKDDYFKSSETPKEVQRKPEPE